MKNKTAIVVTLIPPAVEADPPPINISRSIPIQVAESICEISSEFRPPERGITDAKKVFTSLSQRSSEPNVFWFAHSIAPIKSPPETNKTPEVQSVSLVWREKRLVLPFA